MAELSESSTPEVIEELLTRDDFPGVVVIAATDSDRLAALPYVGDELADWPAWQQNELLQRSKEFLERSFTPPAINP